MEYRDKQRNNSKYIIELKNKATETDYVYFENPICPIYVNFNYLCRN